MEMQDSARLSSWQQQQLQKSILGSQLSQDQQAVDQAFQCGICLSEYTDPRALPCLHTFCASCIKGLKADYNNSLTCPMCRRRHYIADPASLPKNFYLDQLREASGGGKSPARVHSCAECSNKPVAFCDCCSGALCLRHLNSHSNSLLSDCKTVLDEADALIRAGKQAQERSSNSLKLELDSLKNQASMADATLARLSDIIAERRQLIANQAVSLAKRLQRQSQFSASRLAELSLACRHLMEATEQEDLRTAKGQRDSLRQLLIASKLESQRPKLPTSLDINLDALNVLEGQLKAATAVEMTNIGEELDFTPPASLAEMLVDTPPNSQPHSLLNVNAVNSQPASAAEVPLPPATTSTPRALPCDFRPVDLAIASHLPAPLWCHPVLGIAAGSEAPTSSTAVSDVAVASASTIAAVNHNEAVDSWQTMPRPVLACISDSGELHFLDGAGRPLARLALPGVKASRLCECPYRGALVLADAVSGSVRLWLPPSDSASSNSELGDCSASASIWQPRGLASSGATIYVASPGAVHLLDAVTMATRATIRRPFKSADAVAAWPDGGFAVSDCAEGLVHLFSGPQSCQHLGSFACQDASFIEVGILSSASRRRNQAAFAQQRRSARQLFASRSRRHSVIGVDVDSEADDAEGPPRELTAGADAKGGAPGQVNCPLGLRFDAVSGCLYVCDFYNYRLQIFAV